MEQTWEAREVEKEKEVRWSIGEVYNKTAFDFESEELYQEYLEMREDLIYSLLDVRGRGAVEEERELHRRIQAYREENAEQILRTRGRQQRQKAQRIQQIIQEEGAFCSIVNQQAAEHHPFQERYRDLLAETAREAEDAQEILAPASTSPIAPQQLLQGSPEGQRHGTSRARQMSAGGYSPDLHLRKSRHFFLAELRSATGAEPTACAA